jgi:hypothetical protein
MANTPMQHCVQPGRHTSQSPLRCAESASAASTICTSCWSPEGSTFQDSQKTARAADSFARLFPASNPNMGPSYDSIFTVFSLRLRK